VKKGRFKPRDELIFLFQELGTEITTVQEVVNEITSKRQIRRLVVLPYNLQIRNVFEENIQYGE
jgi:RNA-binding protein NOB1